MRKSMPRRKYFVPTPSCRRATLRHCTGLYHPFRYPCFFKCGEALVVLSVTQLRVPLPSLTPAFENLLNKKQSREPSQKLRNLFPLTAFKNAPNPKFVQNLSQRLFLGVPVRGPKFAKNLSKANFGPPDWNRQKQSLGQILGKFGVRGVFECCKGKKVSQLLRSLFFKDCCRMTPVLCTPVTLLSARAPSGMQNGWMMESVRTDEHLLCLRSSVHKIVQSQSSLGQIASIQKELLWRAIKARNCKTLAIFHRTLRSQCGIALSCL